MKRFLPLLLGACSLWVGSASAAEAKAARAFLGEHHIYKPVEGRELRLFVVKPDSWKASDQRPALVFFHGGGWTGGAPTQFNAQAGYLASRGLVCVQVEYRLLKGKSDPPIPCVRDAKSAMRWVRSHAAELGIDPKRIGAGGGSAGGHLAAFVGMVEGNDDPADDLKVSAKAAALVLFNPVFDNGPVDGWGTGRVGERYREFSPAHNITPDDPPAIVFLGRNDALIPVSVVERFRSNMAKAGVRCEAHFYDNQAHGFFNADPWMTVTLVEADKFLASLGWLKGEPTLKAPDVSNAPAATKKASRKATPPK